MPLPFFYLEDLSHPQGTITLPEEPSRHVVQVLRMQAGEALSLTDGRGTVLTAEILEAAKKKALVRVTGTRLTPGGTRNLVIAISLIKHAGRMEWFLEKATEIGITEIIPLICTRTEKQQFRPDRMKNIMISAMLQSQQAWLPTLQKAVSLKELAESSTEDGKFIAHCLEEEKNPLSSCLNPADTSRIILIGPEGDFTREEIDYCIRHHFQPVSLGQNRLRTETAGMVAAVLLSGF